MEFEDYRVNMTQRLFPDAVAEDQIPMTIERDGQVLEIRYPFPGPTVSEIRERIIGVIWVAIVFWIGGTMALIYVRPRDLRWRLLITFFYLTAIFLVSGSLSSRHFWGSAILLRMTCWMMIPVFWHFHYLFPRPLGNLATSVWRVIYGIAILLAGLEFFQIMPPGAFYLAFALAIFGSLILIFAHVIRQPDQRGDLKILAIAAALIMAPLVIFSVIGFLSDFPELGVVALFALPALPGAYLYVIFRHQVGGLEVRANRVISIYLFGIIIGFISITIIAFVSTSLSSTGLFAFAGTIVAISVAIVSIIAYPRFQRWMEHTFLGIPHSPLLLVENYTEKISTNLDRKNLIRLLKGEVLPSLEIRQSALLMFDDNGVIDCVLEEGVEDGDIPQPWEIHQLLNEQGAPRINPETGAHLEPCPWVLLAITLKLGGKPIGIWLLGRRDPDDYYPSWVVTDLQMIAHQTAIAMSNIIQTEQLHALYQSDIDRQEAARARYARWLHDDVLSELSVLKLNIHEDGPTEEYEEIWQSLVDEIRRMIPGIRPVMLTYGLGDAIAELGDELNTGTAGRPTIQINIPDSDCRYGERVEGHLFRIIQEACENAVHHAQAETIRIYGDLTVTHIDLVIEDDGQGFDAEQGLDLASLLAGRHFGLVNMHERAALIGAEIFINSSPGDGSRVHVFYESSDSEAA